MTPAKAPSQGLAWSLVKSKAVDLSPSFLSSSVSCCQREGEHAKEEGVCEYLLNSKWSQVMSEKKDEKYWKSPKMCHSLQDRATEQHLLSIHA